MLFATGLPDLFDGPVAKASGTASVRGAFFDSVADRVADGFMFGGVAWYLAAHHHGEMVLLPFAILAVVSLISYQRAKAELLGLSARGGLMERAERFILLGFCFIAAAISTERLRPRPVGLLRPRHRHRRRALRPGVERGRGARAHAGPDRAPARPTSSTSNRRALVRWREGRVDSRWRAWRQARAAARTARRPTSRPVPAWPGEPLGRWRARRAGRHLEPVGSHLAGTAREPHRERVAGAPAGRRRS